MITLQATGCGNASFYKRTRFEILVLKAFPGGHRNQWDLILEPFSGHSSTLPIELRIFRKTVFRRILKLAI